MPLDIIKEATDLQTMYKAAPDKVNMLVYGDKGSGKTTLVTTAPRPILFDSFDDGGTLSIIDEIREGWILADTRWEKDDPVRADTWQKWLKEMDRRIQSGLFNAMATYALDSLTVLQQISMNFVLRMKGRADGIPQVGKQGDNDYVTSQTGIERIITKILDLPCNVIITAHPDLSQEEGTKKLFIGPAVTGALKTRLPILFSEFYYAKSEVGKEGKQIYSLLTRPDSIFRATTRLGRKGRFEMWEQPNIKALMKKAGLPAEDKPMPWLEKK